MNKLIAWFVGFEFAIGVGVTVGFVIKKIVFPIVDFIVDYWKSYAEFKKWRKCHG